MIFNLFITSVTYSSTSPLPSVTLALDYIRYYMRIFRLQFSAIASSRTFVPTHPTNDLNEGEVARHVFCIYGGPPQANFFEAKVEVCT